eukprot:1159641-Pelagomonas_calceolata.AAC.4
MCTARAQYEHSMSTVCAFLKCSPLALLALCTLSRQAQWLQWRETGSCKPCPFILTLHAAPTGADMLTSGAIALPEVLDECEHTMGGTH